MKRLKTIIDEITQRASFDSVVSTNKREVGYYVKILKKEDREILKTATAKDFNRRF